jgi:hypothetical protein
MEAGMRHLKLAIRSLLFIPLAPFYFLMWGVMLLLGPFMWLWSWSKDDSSGMDIVVAMMKKGPFA